MKDAVGHRRLKNLTFPPKIQPKRQNSSWVLTLAPTL